MTGPRLLDLFGGAGGAGEGYRRAGFDVVAVDDKPHTYPPGRLVVADALDALDELLATGTVDGFRPDAVHASPPCPRHSNITPKAARDDHPDLIGPVRERLRAWGGLYVVENVEGAPLRDPLTLCGSEFGLGAVCRDGARRYLKRHRLFESNAFLFGAGGCRHRGQAVGVYGDGGGGQSTRPSGGKGYKAYPEEARAAMGIDWMSRDDLRDAIPPAYTEHIGGQLVEHLQRAAAA